MVVQKSLISAMCVATLLGVVAARPAAAQSISLTPATKVTTAGTTVTFSGTVTAVAGGSFSGFGAGPGLFVSGVAAPWVTFLKTLTVGGTSFTGALASFAVPLGTPDGSYGFTLEFRETNQPFHTFADGSIVVASAVPEPGAVAFGVLAATGVLGMMVRKRVKA